ncbi:meteorin [Anoplolepis gracilipes]|uniref:meteorin n=1 Tax=Anoplolepis gracilipes TaxID=354296 RepID=UPI003BA3A95C
MLRVIIVAISLIFVSVFAYEHTIVDQCDWSGSGGGESGGVRPVYLRCARGTVFWRYPHGALRVVLSFPSTRGNIPVNISNLGFRTCVKISGPARVFLETGRKLRLIYSPSDGKHENSHRCFRSREHVAALYMEAEDYSFKSTKVKLQYDLDSNSPKGSVLHAPDEEEECRPCSMEELANAYCQSDLVATGIVTAVEQNFKLDTAELVLRVNKILRQVQEAENNENIDITVSSKRSIRVRVAMVCDARHGPGEFVIMAKRRLGDLILVCAPRLETWEQIVQEMDTAPCVLNS